QTQYRNLFQQQFNPGPGRALPPLDIYNPVYAPYDPGAKVRASRTRGHTQNYSFGAKDHIKFLGDKLQIAGGPRYDLYRSRTDNELNGARGRLSGGEVWTYN